MSKKDKIQESKDTGALDTQSESKESKNQEKETSKGFTQEELNAIIAKRLERERQKWQEQMQEELKKAQEEAERMAKLSAEEKEKELLEKQKETLAEKERELRIKENKLYGIEKLEELEIPTKFVDFVISEDRAILEEKIETLQKEWNNALKSEVEKQLRGRTPEDVKEHNAKRKPSAPLTF